MSTSQLLGQVSIGSGAKPESFSVLQIGDNVNGGLRLPRYQTEVEITTLQLMFASSPEAAKGLTIYNVAKSQVQYWDGSQWVSLIKAIVPVIVAENGLTVDNTNTIKKVSLGGTLIENTNINIDNNKLSLTPSSSAVGSINIGNFNNLEEGLQSTKETVTIGKTETGSVPTAALNIVATTSTTESEGGITITSEPAFRMADGSAAAITVGTPVLTTLKENEDGYGIWKKLPTYLSAKPGTLVTGSATPYPSMLNTISWNSGINSSLSIYNPKKISENPLILTEGKWLVTCNIVTRRQLASTASIYTWLYLKDETNNIWLDISGMDPEQNSTYNLSTPYISTYVEVNAGTEIELGIYAFGHGNGSGTNITYLSNQLGSGFNYSAIKLE